MKAPISALLLCLAACGGGITTGVDGGVDAGPDNARVERQGTTCDGQVGARACIQDRSQFVTCMCGAQNCSGELPTWVALNPTCEDQGKACGVLPDAGIGCR